MKPRNARAFGPGAKPAAKKAVHPDETPPLEMGGYNSHLGRTRGAPPGYGLHNHVELPKPEDLKKAMRDAELRQLQAWLDQVALRVRARDR